MADMPTDPTAGHKPPAAHAIAFMTEVASPLIYYAAANKIPVSGDSEIGGGRTEKEGGYRRNVAPRLLPASILYPA